MAGLTCLINLAWEQTSMKSSWRSIIQVSEKMISLNSRPSVEHTLNAFKITILFIKFPHFSRDVVFGFYSVC